MKNILAGLFVFIAANAFALDIITRDGKAYQDCAVKTVERDGVRVVHRDGTAFFDFDVLPSALQQQYGWTPEKSAARKAAQKAEADAQRIAGENARRAEDERAAAVAEAQRIADENARRAQLREAEQKQTVIETANARIRVEKEAEKSAETLFIYGVGAVVVFLFAIPVIVLRGTRHMIVLSLLGILGVYAAFSGVFSSVFGILAFQYVYGWLAKGFRVPVVIVQQPPQNYQTPPHPRPVVAPRAVAKAIPPPRNPPPV
jgi:uncharacterized membrane protein